MKRLKNIALIVFAVSLTILIFSCGKKTTEPEIPSIDGMLYVPGGTFTMGRTNSGSSKDIETDDELPAHSVTLNSFYIGKYQVTQGEYQAVMGSNPGYSFGVGENYPVYEVSWYDAIKYCNLRSMNEGLAPAYSVNSSTDPEDWVEVPWDPNNYAVLDAAICNWDANGYRLLTEAEWEYAARGGTNNPNYLYSGSDNLDAVAWHVNNSDGNTHPVGGKAANGLGIYDMSGNVFEWCWDWFDYYSSSPSNNPKGPESGSSRVMRGGSWHNGSSYCRVVYRLNCAPDGKFSNGGFRVCRSVN